MRSQQIRRRLAPSVAAILALLVMLAGAGAVDLGAASAERLTRAYRSTSATWTPTRTRCHRQADQPLAEHGRGRLHRHRLPAVAHLVGLQHLLGRRGHPAGQHHHSPISAVSAKVVISNGTTTKTYSLWGTFTVQANGQMVLTETSTGNLDLSDKAPNSYNGGNTASCVNSGAIPVVNVTAGGVTTGYPDTGQVLNTGGVDARHCVNGTYTSSGRNESEPWTQVFPGSSPSPSSSPTNTTSSPSPSPTSTVTSSPSPSPTRHGDVLSVSVPDQHRDVLSVTVPDQHCDRFRARWHGRLRARQHDLCPGHGPGRRGTSR